MSPKFGFRSVFHKILFLFLGCLATVTAGMSYWNYRMMESEAVGRMRDRLEAIAVVGSLRLDVEDQMRVQHAPAGPGDLPSGEEAQRAFNALVAALRKIQRASNLSTDVYTLRLAADKAAAVRGHPEREHADALEFVAMTNGTPFFKHRLSYRPFMGPAILDGRLVSTDLYRDDFGSWVSALAPLKAADGSVVAVLEVDASFDEYHKKNIAIIKRQTFVGFMILLPGMLVVFLLARSITRPLGTLIEQARRLGDGHYSSPIRVVASDEVGVLAHVLDKSRQRIRSFLQDILDVAPFVMIVFDRNFVATETVSRTARECFGGVVAGKRLSDMLQGKTGLQPPPSEEFLRRIVVHQTSAKTFSETMKHACERLEIAGRVYSVRFLPRFEDGRMASVFMLGEDITENILLQAKMMQMDRMVAVGTLAAGVAHEINNPLAYVIANLEFIADAHNEGHGRSQAEFNTGLAEAREGAERIRKIVLDLKLFARAEKDRREKVSLPGVIDSAVNVAWNEIRHRAKLVKDFGAIPIVEANEARLGQVFLNLLMNAAQAIPVGHVEANEIRIATRTDEQGRAVIEVRDTGNGISADVLPRVFDPFFTTKPVGQGTGLGLSICRNIVHEFGGEIAVESEIGTGTVFRVALPPARVETAASPASEPAAVLKARRGHILIVDDEPAVGRAMRRILAREHDLVEAVTSGQAALDRLATEPFDVIISDLMMPEMTGMDFFAEVNRRFPDHARRFIFVSGGAFTPHAREFLDRVPNPKLEKPVKTRDLRAVIHEILEPSYQTAGAAR